MKLSKLESEGTQVQKIFKPESKDKNLDLKKELDEVKELLHLIIKKLDKKS